ncbi:hypothetical protein [Virgibacillus salexigens]|uniref:hypothetical protein n=1 Tax=Virgibacillus salexigens TaxID=61016 RepID=UPI00190A7E36|nr:hypothetical protein [Virgibacillus salexigens]
MGNLYAIHGGESVFAIVKASSKKNAFDVYASNQMEDDKHIWEYISEFKINDCLLEEYKKTVRINQ